MRPRPTSPSRSRFSNRSGNRLTTAPPHRPAPDGTSCMAILDLARRVGPFLVVFCAAMWLWSVAESFAISTRLGRAGPDLWPKIVLLLMLGAALWGMAEALFKRQPHDDTSILIANATRAAGHEEDARQDLVADAGDPSDRR